jgi:hypothetical protein
LIVAGVKKGVLIFIDPPEASVSNRSKVALFDHLVRGDRR